MLFYTASALVFNKIFAQLFAKNDPLLSLSKWIIPHFTTFYTL